MDRIKLAVASAVVLVLMGGVAAQGSPGDPIHSQDITRDGWETKDWYHFGDPLRGAVEVEVWVDVHWPCGGFSDEDGDCVVEDVRGHSLTRKIMKVRRTQTNLTRLGRYPAHPADPAGVLAENTTSKNSGASSTVEHVSPWVPVQQFCGQNAFQIWTRVRLDVRWSDNRLSKGLTMLSRPTWDYIASICGVSSLSMPERRTLRDQLRG
jgi:hypothetical protein